MPDCQYANGRLLRAVPHQLKREVLFCRCPDCGDARAMNAGTRISLRKSVRERLGALQWTPPVDTAADEDSVA